jgi:plastocyanin
MHSLSSRRRGVGIGEVLVVVFGILVIAGAAFSYVSIANTGEGITSSTQVTTGSGTSASGTSASTTASNTNSGTSSGGGSTVLVIMPNGVGSSQSLNFEPSRVVVVVGVNNTVVWTNNDTAAHTVTSTAVPSGASTFNSGNMAAGAIYNYTFTTPGSYNYTCTYHAWMRATVVVKQG